jgi:hypothetical protein
VCAFQYYKLVFFDATNSRMMPATTIIIDDGEIVRLSGALAPPDC